MDIGFRLKNYKSFGTTGAGFESIAPINLIIGKNNIGKSSLLQALEFLSKHGNLNSEIKSSIEISRNLQEMELKRIFSESTSGGSLGGRHWHDHGVKFVGRRITWKESQGTSMDIAEINCPASAEELEYLSRLSPTTKLRGLTYVKLDADRDITPEGLDGDILLSSNGAGATQLIHKYLHYVGYDRSIVQNTLLNALNKIFYPDIRFNEIATRFHQASGQWEIFLGEEAKGPFALSASGSGLKTVLLTLINLLVRPNRGQCSVSEYIFSLEELENNLHPALQRNLFSYLQEFAVDNDCHIFITTHSNIAIDIYGKSEHCQILHVTRGEDGVAGTTFKGEREGHGVLDDLGVRASDLLQANGLIWVEGPSDRVFLNKWIELWSDGELREGLDFQFVFYGGSILANIDASTPSTEITQAIQAFKINRNFAFICDSDRKTAGGALKPRVSKLINEVSDTRSLVWVTRCTEIENYIPKEAFEAVHNKRPLPQIGEYESILSYLKTNKISKAKSYTDKHSKAFIYAEHLTKHNLTFRPELNEQLTRLVTKIHSWNK